MEGLSLLKKFLQKGDLLFKLDLKDPYFSVVLHKISLISKLSMARKYLRVSMPVLLSGACSENFHKTNENSDCINETFDYVVDNLPGRHLGYGKLARGNHQIRIAESGVCKLPKIYFESFSSDSISESRNGFLIMIFRSAKIY